MSSADKIAAITGAHKASKTLLKSARACLLHLNERQEEMDLLRTALLPSGIRYDKEKVQVSHDDGILSDTLCEIMEIEGELDKERNEAAHTINKALRLINSIEQPEYRRLLRLRYINCRSWRQIAVEMNYGESTIYKLHGSALLEAEKKLKE